MVLPVVNVIVMLIGSREATLTVGRGSRPQGLEEGSVVRLGECGNELLPKYPALLI